MLFELATNEIGLVITVEFFERFNDLRAICSPAVAFATATAYLAPQYSAAYLSKSKVFCPCVKDLNLNCFTTS